MNFKTFVSNPVKVCMFFVALVLLGVLSYRRLPMNLFPDIQTPRITLVATTDGMPPEQAERLLTADLERQLSSIKGIAGITSYTREKNIIVHVDFHWGQDMEFAYLDVKKNLSSFEAKDNIEKVDVYRFDPNAAPLMTLAFTGEVDRIQTTSLIENSLKPKLETIEGVAYVKTNGIKRQEVLVEINEDIMSQYGLTTQQLLEAIRSNDIATAGGVITEGNEEMVLKFISRLRGIEDIRNVVVKIINDHPIHLGDLGDISIQGTRDEVIVHQDGLDSITLDVYKEPEANAVFTARRMRDFVSILNQQGHYGIKIAADLSEEIESAISEVVRTAMIGMALAMIILLVFLRNLSATLVVAVSIPLSIIGTFNLMYFQSLSLNIMTLGGLALGAGMLVDNAIVVIENIFRHRQLGADPAQAAIQGTREVAMAITAATLTTIVVFVPLVYVHGIAGILFKDQAMTVVYSLLVSLIVALGLIPMLAARMGKSLENKPGRVNAAYGRFLSASLRLRWLLLLLFALALALTARAMMKIPSEFFPEAVGGRMSMTMEMPQGTPLNRTESIVGQIERSLLNMRYRHPELAGLLQAYERWRLDGNEAAFLLAAKGELATIPRKPAYAGLLDQVQERLFPIGTKQQNEPLEERLGDLLSRQILIESITSTVGVDPDSIQTAQDKILGPNTARMDIVMNPAILRELSATDLIAFLRGQVSNVPGLSVDFESRNQFIQDLLGKNRGDLVLEVHADRLDDLRTSAGRVAEKLAATSGLINVRSNLMLGEDEYELAPDRDAMIRGDFKLDEISSQIQAYLEGDESDMLNLDKGDMTITISNPRAEKAGLQGLMDLSIQSAGGTSEKVRDLVHLRQKRGLLEIMRVNQEKTLLVMADLGGIGYSQAVETVRLQMDGVQWPAGASWNMSGEEIKRRESFDKLRFALIIALVLVYMVIASILESVVHPVTIMISVPFALTGVTGAFLWTGTSLNIMGYIGVVMLVGIVVNNAIVLLDAVRQLREEGLEIREAVVLAGRHRLRPILMTSLTTILALFPLALGFGNGAELRRPMAIAVIGGLTSSTLLTLWIMPGIYLCVEDVIGVFRRALAFLSGLIPGAKMPAGPIPNPEDAS